MKHEGEVGFYSGLPGNNDGSLDWQVPLMLSVFSNSACSIDSFQRTLPGIGI